ncbi:MAG TPA: hypothetical protein PLO24_00195 [Bacteroidales bacterium]|jgi:hypothetical protein|nr:hypothetical protein [Bacteroidales bacterium]HOS72776.1 hypothetical protein [Bacteroidales bacterium]HQH23032.1 hypothetical protein [Bacteroidales bacterium]
MTTLIPISVSSWSGYKADEYPKSFSLQGKKYQILEITDRWYQGDMNPEYPAASYFRVTTVEGGRFILKHETGTDTWYLIREKPA